VKQGRAAWFPARSPLVLGSRRILAAIWVVVLVVNQFTSITAAIVNEEEAVLVGVSEEFAKACEKPVSDEEAAIAPWLRRR
jgi:hypothetical protein